jgi:lipopolysaccharide/colanic/teichoic acid biosynthesis glycosyltransferase
MAEWLQRLTALVIAVASGPLLAVLALVIRLDSPGPAFFLAERVGEGGRRFRLLKLRTMRDGAATAGPRLSLHRDARVTRIGRLLRRYRIDELPQVWNVVRGEMLLVGPRPEDPRFVDLADPLHRRVFLAKPGITGITQLAYSSEAELLDAADPERQYRETILPAKLALDARYLARRSATLDLWILAQTLRTAAGHPPAADAIERALGVA